MSSAIHVIINGTILPPIVETIDNGARCENGPMIGLVASSEKMMTAIMLEKRMIGHRRPLRWPSESHVHVKEYTVVKALLRVGYSFCVLLLVQLRDSRGRRVCDARFELRCRLAAGPSYCVL
jgi:hypothetical protein